MAAERYITRSCGINSGEVCVNLEVLFSNRGHLLPDFLLSVYQHFALSYPKFYKMDNLSKLGWLASELLLKNAGMNEKYDPARIAVVLANANSSLDNDLKYVKTISEGASPSVFVYTLPNIVIGELCIRNNFKGEHAFFIQDEFDADFIFKQVNYLLDQQLASACICGWVDVLGDNYKAALFLVEDKQADNMVTFSPNNMTKIFNLVK
ncbi:hypothetical protein [Mucilaginibacter glaciei]|uniref:Beta-ketoacyl synthase-like protein n=1 Tax=Mucilaginibacter glaciei TaxID=2772109 RepID=A0A926RZB0_9SPHI|nr:hypothetical protein [Mucilaginibacter glaciei]MBD1391675.1 hypothetical protein [Mucilaginibacter glaciei]